MPQSKNSSLDRVPPPCNDQLPPRKVIAGCTSGIPIVRVNRTALRRMPTIMTVIPTITTGPRIQAITSSAAKPSALVAPDLRREHNASDTSARTAPAPDTPRVYYTAVTGLEKIALSG